MEKRDADVRADIWHAVFAAAAAGGGGDVAGPAKMTSRPLRTRVYTCDK